MTVLYSARDKCPEGSRGSREFMGDSGLVSFDPRKVKRGKYYSILFPVANDRFSIEI